MSYSPDLNLGFNCTKTRSPYHTTTSGMCSMCVEGCTTPCEIGLAAVLGTISVYPTTTGANQIASEKVYPLDYSHFNVNGRAFGAQGVKAVIYDKVGVFNVKTRKTYGSYNPITLDLPFVLPALIKLNWKDYFAGAAIAGVTAMVGEDAKSKDPNLKIENGKITEFPLIGEIIDCYKEHHRGFGQLVFQCNVEDDMLGMPEIAITKYGAEAIEFKLGQGAKGIQPVVRLKNLEEAKKQKAMGYIVYPDPSDPATEKAYAERTCGGFIQYNRPPLWDEEFFAKRIAELRGIGMKNVYIKMAGFDPQDIERVLRIAAENKVDMVTFDGAGGGSGYSPTAMMNEWGLPTVVMEAEVVKAFKRIKDEYEYMPAITIAGGIASEGDAFKAFALGDGCVTAVGLCRATMAAAMQGAAVGKMIKEGNVPEHLKKYGTTIPEIFGELDNLRAMYGVCADDFEPGAIGVFSYLRKMTFGTNHLLSLNRKFNIVLASKEDVIPLTAAAKELWNEI